MCPKCTISPYAARVTPTRRAGAYQAAIQVLYALAYTIKMSKKGDHQIAGYFDYVVPPLEGFWYQENTEGVDYSRKADFRWISVIRLPDFVTEADFNWGLRRGGAEEGAGHVRRKLLDAQGGALRADDAPWPLRQ